MEAAAMWKDFKDLWQYVNPQSTNYEFMQEPLASEEVWIAWDHVADFPSKSGETIWLQPDVEKLRWPRASDGAAIDA